MADSDQDKIDRLLREGLNYYGTGDVAEAVQRWKQVLVLDPQHPEARDYLETASLAAPDEEPAQAALRAGEPSADGLVLGDPPAEDAPVGDLAADGSLFPDGASNAEGAAPAAGASEESTAEALAQEAMRLFRDGDLEAALDLFATVALRDGSQVEAQNYVEMIRSQLLKSYRERVGQRDRPLRLCIDQAQVMKFNLPATAGFVLSLVDGSTSVDDLMSLSGLDAFETLRIVTGLMKSGILEVAS